MRHTLLLCECNELSFDRSHDPCDPVICFFSLSYLHVCECSTVLPSPHLLDVCSLCRSYCSHCAYPSFGVKCGPSSPRNAHKLLTHVTYPTCDTRNILTLLTRINDCNSLVFLFFFSSSPSALSLHNKDTCDSAFHFNCGNSRCIRQAFLCDGHDNCGNYQDEAFCTFDTLSAVLLFSLLTMTLIFLTGILWFDSHPHHVHAMRHMTLDCLGRRKSVQLNSID